MDVDNVPAASIAVVSLTAKVKENSTEWDLD